AFFGLIRSVLDHKRGRPKLNRQQSGAWLLCQGGGSSANAAAACLERSLRTLSHSDNSLFCYKAIQIVNQASMDSKGRHVVVCDNGTGFVKCGRALRELIPMHIFPSLVGRPILAPASFAAFGDVEIRTLMVGDELREVRQIAAGQQLELTCCHLYDYIFASKKMNLDCPNTKRPTLLMLSADLRQSVSWKGALCAMWLTILLRRSGWSLETTVLAGEYTLPDGRVSGERFQAPEALFQPHLVDVDGVWRGGTLLFKHHPAGGHGHQARVSTRRLCYRAAPTTMCLKGDTERLSKFKIRIEDPPRRKHMVFLGGAILADIMKDHDDKFWISRQEYQEMGVGALKKLSGAAA
uniref:Actin-related protein 2 n=1 Tax=Macrostomum lignano TaxID=282301 RepID=A0A1I8JS33_9PLAT